jgi:hypothetical protein
MRLTVGNQLLPPEVSMEPRMVARAGLENLDKSEGGLK